MYDMLRRKSEGLRNDVIEFTQRLVQIPSVSFEENEAAKLVKEQMERLGYDKVIVDEYGNVVGIIYGRETEPTILLTSHLDTAMAGEECKWKKSPYSGDVEGGKLSGCGASDCKGGLAAQIFAGALLKRSLLPLRGNVVVSATVGEEQGGSCGIRGLIEKSLEELELKPMYAILGEPTNLGLYYGHRGWVEVDIKVEGANMFDVDDAVGTILNEFRHSISNKDKNNLPMTVTTDSAAYELNGRVKRAVIGLSRRLDDTEEPETVVNQIKHNAKLATAAIGGNIGVDVAIRKETRKMYTGVTTAVQKITHAWSIDPFSTLMERSRQALSAAGCEVRPGKWQLGRAGMATAGGVLTNEFKIPTIGYGPGNEDVIHAANEYVETQKIAEAVYGTAAIVHSLVGVPVFGWTLDEI